ncbi:General control protein, partial [Teratosphaeriaceae sp. CCFEE 6253]
MGGGGTLPPNTSRSASRLTLQTVNVAYEGTFGDLSSARDAMFGAADFDFDALMNSNAVDHGMPASDFTAINGGTGTGTTVSPRDVFNT